MKIENKFIYLWAKIANIHKIEVLFVYLTPAVNYRQ